MKNMLLFILLFICCAKVEAKEKECECKCVTKDEEGNYTTMKASGKDRQEAGENLKKKMKPRTCELSPTCTGSCDI